MDADDTYPQEDDLVGPATGGETPSVDDSDDNMNNSNNNYQPNPFDTGTPNSNLDDPHNTYPLGTPNDDGFMNGTPNSTSTPQVNNHFLHASSTQPFAFATPRTPGSNIRGTPLSQYSQRSSSPSSVLPRGDVGRVFRLPLGMANTRRGGGGGGGGNNNSSHGTPSTPGTPNSWGSPARGGMGNLSVDRHSHGHEEDSDGASQDGSGSGSGSRIGIGYSQLESTQDSELDSAVIWGTTVNLNSCMNAFR